MTWFRVDDGFGEHPKVDSLGAQTPHALCVWLLCGNAAARALTDGAVSEAMLSRACSALSPTMRRKAVEALVRVGLWEVREDGWAFKDWLDHQPSREQVLAKREAERARQNRHRAPTSRVSHAVTPTVTPTVTPSVSHSTPSRPVPSRPGESERARAPEADLATRADARDAARRAIIRHYAAAYRAAYGEDWLHAPHGQAIEHLAAWCAAKPDPAAAAAQLIAAAFAHPPWRAQRVPLKWVAEDPGAAIARAAAASAIPDDFSHASTDTEAPF